MIADDLLRVIRACNACINELSSCAIMDLIYGQDGVDIHRRGCPYCLFYIGDGECITTDVQSVGVE